MTFTNVEILNNINKKCQNIRGKSIITNVHNPRLDSRIKMFNQQSGINESNAQSIMLRNIG